MGSKESGNECGASEGAEDTEADGGDNEGDDQEIVETGPKRHPPLRAAAVCATPKMLRAAVDTAVELVIDNLDGRGRRGSRQLASLPIHNEQTARD